jgi:DNA-binding PadR family transcriptional regulator
MNETILSRGNISNHMSWLEGAGCITSRTSFSGKAPRTRLALTPKGSDALGEYFPYDGAAHRRPPLAATVIGDPPC